MDIIFLDKVKAILSRWNFQYYESPDKMISFQISTDNCTDISIYIYIDENQTRCSICSTYPIIIHADYSYFVYRKMNEINYHNNIGTYRYDEASGEVSCVCTFFCEGNFENKFVSVFLDLLLLFDKESDGFIKISRGIISQSELDSISKKLLNIMKQIN